MHKSNDNRAYTVQYLHRITHAGQTSAKKDEAPSPLPVVVRYRDNAVRTRSSLEACDC